MGNDYKTCIHKEWLGEPAGYTPVTWQCADCGVRMTSGEMVIYGEMIRQRKMESKPTGNVAEPY